LNRGSRRAAQIAAAALAALVVVATVEAFLPRKDWYAPPAFGAFRVVVGDFIRWDKVVHGYLGFSATLLGTLALLLGRGWTLRRSTRVAWLFVAGWALLVETVQGFLAHRNAELFDFFAALLGGALVVVTSWFAGRSRGGREAE
jgi:VanZ family protein